VLASPYEDWRECPDGFHDVMACGIGDDVRLLAFRGLDMDRSHLVGKTSGPVGPQKLVFNIFWDAVFESRATRDAA